MRVGIYRFMDALARHDIKATTSINASVCLSYPHVAQAILDAGWEFMGHGFQQQAASLIDDERFLTTSFYF